MEYGDILFEVRGATAWITLNRPERRNPLGAATVGELCHALDRAAADEAVRAVALTGAGKTFSAGGDLSQMAGGGGPVSTRPGSFADLVKRLADFEKPVVAAVNGHALAGGCGLVAACHLAVASGEAAFGTPEINVGLWPMVIMAPIFRAVGRKKGLEMMLTGERIAAEEALRIGLVNRVVPADRLAAETESLLATLTGKSPAILRLGLRAFRAMEGLPLERAVEELQNRFFEVLGTEDAREGLMAFLEKRPPAWKGR